MSTLRRDLSGLLLVGSVAVGGVVITVGGGYALELATLVAVYAGLAISLDLLVGTTGLISAGHASFFGIGAYLALVLYDTYHLPFPLVVVFACSAAAIVAVLLGRLSVRLGGIYFTLVTMAFGIIFSDLLSVPGIDHWTGGAVGITATRVPSVLRGGVGTFWILAALLVGIAIVKYAVANTSFGLRLAAIRDDEALTRSLGVSTTPYKVATFAVSGALAGVVGALYGPYFGYLDPTQFNVWFSFQILVWVLVGGSGTLFGPVLGVLLVWVLPEAVNFPPAATLIMSGGLLVLVMLFYRGGIMGGGRAVLGHTRSLRRPVLPLRRSRRNTATRTQNHPSQERESEPVGDAQPVGRLRDRSL